MSYVDRQVLYSIHLHLSAHTFLWQKADRNRNAKLQRIKYLSRTSKMAEHVEDSMAMQYIGTFPYPIAPWPLAGTKDAPQELEILNIRRNDQNLDMACEIKSRLRDRNNNGLRSLPSALLWTERVSKHLEKRTAVQTFLMERHVDEIAMSLMPGTILVDTDSSSPSTSRLLIEAIESHHKIVDYFALGLDRNHLERVMKDLDPTRFNYVRCHGLLGSQEDGRAWVAKYENKQRPVCVLSLGSTITINARDETIAFWRAWSDLLTVNNKFNSNNARVILGLDCSKNSDGRHQARQHQRLIDEDLLHDVLENASLQLGSKVFEASEWSLQDQFEEGGKTHTQYLVPQDDVKLDDIQIKAGEKIVLAQNHKYSAEERETLLRESNLKELQRYTTDDGSFGMMSKSSRCF